MAKNKYSKLPIDVSKLYGWINLWCESEFGDDKYKIEKRDITQRIQYLIHANSMEIRLDFIKCTGGLLTITPNVGTQHALSVKLADSIYDRVKDINKDSPFSNGFSIKLSQEDYDSLLGLITGEEGNTVLNNDVQQEAGKANYILHRIQGPYGDTVVIKYYPNTKRMQFQGKPLALFNEIVSMLSEECDSPDDVVDAQLTYCDVKLNRDDIFEEMEAVLGNRLYSYLTKSLRAILSTAFIMSKISMNLPDNSVIVQQALRAYEGFLKKLLRDQDIELTENELLGDVFGHRKADNTFYMHTESAAKVNDPNKERVLTAMYQFYYQHRHPYSHASADDFDTVIIEDRKVADELFNEVIQSMKAGFTELQ